jgi:hypothetical protein
MIVKLYTTVIKILHLHSVEARTLAFLLGIGCFNIYLLQHYIRTQLTVYLSAHIVSCATMLINLSFVSPSGTEI